MKKLFLLPIALAFALTACEADAPAPAQPPVDDNVVVVDDCPEGQSTTGEPCK